VGESTPLLQNRRMTLTRRKFLRATTSSLVGLVIGFRLEGVMRAADSEHVFEPNAYIRVAPDNVITLWVTRSELGQGVRTNLPAALAEELEVDLSQVLLEQAMPGGRFKDIRLRTSGSGSSSGTFAALRLAGAAAREMLISAAAETWGVDRATCRAASGSVTHSVSGRSLTYGELVERAARLRVPTDPPLKNPADFRLIGRPLKRIDGPAIASGQAVYGCDVRLPGMLIAVMERCPILGGKLASFDGAKALAVPGVRHIVPIRSGLSGGVAVIADNTWAAMQGRDALHVEWDKGAHADFDSGRHIENLKAAFSQEGYPIRRDGEAAQALAGAPHQLEAVYEYPFQAHAPLETMNCTADVRSDSCEIWVPTQAPEIALANTAKTLGLNPDAVKIHITLVGGAFGRRLIVDYVDEAVEVSRKIGKPIQLTWTRADDMRHGFFHPASVERVQAGLGDGKILAWVYKSAGSDLSVSNFPPPEEKKDPNVYAKYGLPWGAYDNFYNLPTMKTDFVPVESPVPTGPWRAVFYPARVLARECFIDEIAHSLNKDPLQFRIDLLQPGNVWKLGDQEVDRARAIKVLEFAREKSGWAKPLLPEEDRLVGRGIAINVYDSESYIAQVAEASVARDLTDLRVHRIVCVVDCGLVINPLGLQGQVESGVAWGLSATLFGGIDFREGRAVKGTYDEFRVLRMNEMPRVETYIIPSNLDPGGFGEHSVPPVAPAVANAIFAACGKRLRRLPLTFES
jgi:isoquinoline 1-oxidoreductase beta subunit